MGKSIIDEAYVELERVRTATQDERNEKESLEKEKNRLVHEITELNAKQKNIKSYIEEKERESKKRIESLLKQAEDDNKKSMQVRAGAESVLAGTKEKQSELDKLISQEKSKIAEYSSLINQNEKLKAKLEDIACYIVNKLKG